MGFCTLCGNNIDKGHRFCASCGAPVPPPTEGETAGKQLGPVTEKTLRESEPEHQATPAKNLPNIPSLDDCVDRKTLFGEGMLVLTSRDLILYTGDEKDELKRIPVSSIESCGYSTLRRGLVVKRRINEEDNFEKFLTKKHATLSDAKSKKQHHEKLLRETRMRDKRRQIKEQISEVEGRIVALTNELAHLESDPTKIKRTQEKMADIKKEVFKLPKNYEDKSDKTAREEYKIWEYAVNRRMIGPSQIKIETMPYDAVVTINGRAAGTTPLTIGKPLVDAAVLDGKYRVNLLKEGYEPVGFSVAADLDEESFMERFDLLPRKNPDYGADQSTEKLRGDVPDRTVDLSLYDVEREVEGSNELLLLTGDGILVMSKDGERCLLEIPYGAINEAKYDRGFLRGSKAVKINYNEPHFQNVGLDFWIDDQDGGIPDSELRQRSESLADILNKKRKESKVRDVSHRIRSPAYFTITEKDIKSNFSRFEPFEFEILVAKLFEKKGYKTTVTREREDFGVDVLAETGKEKIVIQVKHWQASVGGPDVHKTLGSMMTFGASRAMVVTSSDFTNQAYEIQKRGTPVELWNGSRLRDEFRQHLVDATSKAREDGS